MYGCSWLVAATDVHATVLQHYDDVIMGAMTSQITSLTIVYSTVYSDTDQRKHQSPASLAFVRGIHRGPVNSPHKWPVTRNCFSFDDVIMSLKLCILCCPIWRLYTEDRDMSWCQLCRQWWYHRVSWWQPVVPPLTTQSAFWQLFTFEKHVFTATKS